MEIVRKLVSNLIWCDRMCSHRTMERKIGYFFRYRNSKKEKFTIRTRNNSMNLFLTKRSTRGNGSLAHAYFTYTSFGYDSFSCDRLWQSSRAISIYYSRRAIKRNAYQYSETYAYAERQDFYYLPENVTAQFSRVIVSWFATVFKNMPKKDSE